uniref:Ig-like domain-containing protein n=1 Tax=Paramormyrops kingsleyae TaxID=1676925 RepID=A0A3B3S3P8_9TELE
MFYLPLHGCSRYLPKLLEVFAHHAPHVLLGIASSLVTHSIPWNVPCPQKCVSPTVDCNDLLLSQLPAKLPLETQTLRLQSNLITNLDQRDLQGLANLTELDLSQNTFSNIRHLQVTHIPALLSLHMEENQLHHIPDSAFSGLPNLQELYLNHNQLRTISPGAFMGLGNLLRLHLNSNHLRMIDRHWFHALPQTLPGLKFLDLNKNPIQLSVRFIDPQSTFCSEPPDLKAKRVKEVSFQEMSECCLPLIAPGTFPHYVKVRHGDNLALHCRALAEPEPSIYWVSPKGLRLIPFASHSPYRVLAEGTWVSQLRRQGSTHVWPRIW